MHESSNKHNIGTAV